MAVIGILAALSAREYSKYMEKAYLSSYALPLARSCFMELSEYCAANPNASGVTPATLGQTSVCNRLSSSDGIETGRGFVKITSAIPDKCNQYGTPNYDRNIDVTLSSASRYQIVCTPKLVESSGQQVNISTLECSIQTKSTLVATASNTNSGSTNSNVTSGSNSTSSSTASNSSSSTSSSSASSVSGSSNTSNNNNNSFLLVLLWWLFGRR